MQDSVKERLMAYLSYKGISKAEFGRRIGASSAFVSSIRSSISDDKVKSIALEFPDLNRDWLLYGEGSMLKAPQGSTVTVGDFNVTMGDDNSVRGNHNSNIRHDKSAELQAKVAILENEVKHLNEIIEQLKAQLADKERTIGILMKTN